MRKYLKLLCVMASWLLLLNACDEEAALEKPMPEVLPVETSQPAPTPEPTPEPTAEPVPEATPEPTPELAVETPPEAVPEPTPQAPVIPETVAKIKVDIPETAGYPELNFGSPYTASGALSNAKKGWYFNRNTEHTPPSAQSDFDIRQFDGYYLGDTGRKCVYLTFDEGYENGYTEKLLDVLKDKQVPAAFFVTETYITANPDLILRMVDEGHVVGNHSVTHKSFPDLSDGDIIWELEETAKTYKELTGLDMPPFFRPPMGEYSARTLAVTMNAGYKSIFWSFAYKDWETDNQPGKAVAYETIMKDLHNGQIPLLHAVSSSNVEALPDVIDSYIEHGYEFLTLYDLP